MGRFFKIFLNLSQRNLLKNLVILFKIWRKIGPIGILNGSLFLAKLEFVLCLLSNSAAAHPYQNQTWVPLRITDQLWAYWGNVYGPSVVFHHKSLLICWFRHCFVSEVLISTVVKFEKRKKKVCPRMVSRYERGNLLWLNEDVTFPRWPPWEFSRLKI